MAHSILDQLAERLEKLTEEGEADFLKDEKLIKNAPPFVWIAGFLCITGSYFYDREGGREPNDLDVIVKAVEDGDKFAVIIDPSLRLKLDRILKARTGVPSTHWLGVPQGPNHRYQPIYDLVLMPREPEIHEMNEKEFAAEFYKGPDLSVCMKCKESPEYEILFNEGVEFFWFCHKHTLDFIANRLESKFRTGHTSTGINWIKAVSGKASLDPKHNDGPDIQEALTEELDIENLHKEVKIFEKAEDEQIVGGVVYAPDEEDAQGDEASSEEIRKAAHDFMENAQRFKTYHKGKPIRAKVLESYLAPVDFTVQGINGMETIKKGSWILFTRILNKEIWEKIKSGEMLGYSMAGRSQVG